VRRRRDPDRLIRALLLSAIGLGLAAGMVVFVLYVVFVIESLKEL
jgi:hypothetical protein